MEVMLVMPSFSASQSEHRNSFVTKAITVSTIGNSLFMNLYLGVLITFLIGNVVMKWNMLFVSVLLYVMKPDFYG